jgi:hypothetical protein
VVTGGANSIEKSNNPLGVIPGCTAHVLYTKESALKATKQMGSGWAHLTSGAIHSKPIRRAAPALEFDAEKDELFQVLQDEAYYQRRKTRIGTEITLSALMEHHLRAGKASSSRL